MTQDKDDRPIPQRAPVVGVCEPGEYWWCSCGRSRNQPYCDGTHKSSNHLPLRVKVESERKVAWCACKRTKTPPWCDGAHKNLPPGGPAGPTSGFRPPIKMD
jgi:CDGSH-type Zn-finger protein